MVESEGLRDEELVGFCQGGQSQYFEPLVQRYMQKAFHIAFGFTRETESAKDLSQDAFLRAFARIKQFDGRSSFTLGFTASWLIFVSTMHAITARWLGSH